MVAQLPRQALLWLIVCQVALLAPMVIWLPFWILLVSLTVAVWRYQVFEGRWSYPRRGARSLMAVAGTLAVLASFRSLLGLEPMVALLLVAGSLKLLEARSVRDGYVLAILGFFICLTLFLFDQGIGTALYTLGCVMLLLTALIALNQSPLRPVARSTLATSAGLLAQALPLMVLPFLLFPRIAPLWEVPIKRHGASTGMSDILRPGDVAELGQDDSVAFRVKFSGETPPLRELYWRGLTLGKFNDGAWLQHDWRQLPLRGLLGDPPARLGESLRYRIIQLPTQQRWLYGLRYAEVAAPGTLATGDFNAVAVTPIEFEYGYEVESWPATQLEASLPSWRRALESGYPLDRDPRTRTMVNRWHRENPAPRAMIAKALAWFRQEPFVYTLRPTPISDDNFVDAFLFDTRRGFCEHFAYSFTVMMRQAGIPARIVAGYQGGEINPVNGTVVVRQLDAHAWAEVWLAGEGWLRVDPTGAVSPDRIEIGLAGTLRDDEGFLAGSPMSAIRFANLGVVSWLRMQYDAMAWRWQSWVVGFGADNQMDVLERLLGEVTPWRLLLFFVGGCAVVLTPGAWLLFRPRRGERRHPAEREFIKLCQQLAKQGVVRARGEPPRLFIDRAKACVAEEQAAALERQYQTIERALYRSE